MMVSAGTSYVRSSVQRFSPRARKWYAPSLSTGSASRLAARSDFVSTSAKRVTPGISSWAPFFRRRMSSERKPLAFMISPCDTPYARAMSQSVSPSAMVCITVGGVAAGAGLAGELASAALAGVAGMLAAASSLLQLTHASAASETSEKNATTVSEGDCCMRGLGERFMRDPIRAGARSRESAAA